MGLVKVEIELSNPRKTSKGSVSRSALTDTGALHLCIPKELAEELDLEELHSRRVTTADGSSHECPYVGPIKIQVANRECFTGAIMLGNEVLLGAVPVEDMDLWISPSGHQVVPNPASPDTPLSVAKGIRTRLR
ncbi:MAG: clan AA aspartic protease [Opitutales bacterium]